MYWNPQKTKNGVKHVVHHTTPLPIQSLSQSQSQSQLSKLSNLIIIFSFPNQKSIINGESSQPFSLIDIIIPKSIKFLQCAHKSEVSTVQNPELLPINLCPLFRRRWTRHHFLATAETMLRRRRFSSSSRSYGVKR